MSAPASHSSPSASAGRRRLWLGSSATVACGAAVLLAVALNLGLFWQLNAAPPSVRRWTRLDLSATRAHTLAPRTVEVLRRLDGDLEMVALQAGPATGPDLEAARRRVLGDLLSAYAAGSGHLRPRSIDASAHADEAAAVQAQVAAAFAGETRGAHAALAKGAEQAAGLAKRLQALEPAVRALQEADYPLASQRAEAGTVATALLDLRRQLETLAETTRKGLQEPMPDLEGLRTIGWNGVFQASRVCDDARARLQRLRPQGSGALESALRLARDLGELGPEFQQPFDTYRGVRPARAYAQARLALAGGEAVVLLGRGRARVLPMADLWRPESAGGQGDLGAFTGEERLTGAIASLSLAQPPRAVFLSADAGTALDQGEKPGLYTFVADRLQAVGFEVHELALSGPDSAQRLPAAAPGQRTVWIALPFLEPKPGQAADAPAALRQRAVAEHLSARLEAGDSALVLLGADPFADPARLAAANLDAEARARRTPLPTLLAAWGIRARPWEVLAHEEQQPGYPPRTVVAASNLAFTDHAASAGLRGLAFHVEKPFRVEPAEGGAARPMVELRLPRLWPLGFDEMQPQGDRRFNPQRALESAAVASAAERGGARLVAVGDPVWASDFATTFGTAPDLPPAGAAGAALRPGGLAAWPGNAEFFTQAACWLAHEDTLLSPGARSQEVRRIGPLTDRTRVLTLWWLSAGLPALALILGLGVWLRRRF